MTRAGGSGSPVVINRAPVLTLWAAIVAERLGFDREEALTLGKAVAGLNAYSKGRSLGLFAPTPKDVKAKRDEARQKAGVFKVELLHRAVPVVHTPEGLRAVAKEQPVDPQGVERYLQTKFGADLARVEKAMAALAGSRSPEVLADQAYALYEQFRPAVPAGVRGWGAAGELDLGKVEALSRSSAAKSGSPVRSRQ